MSTEPVHHDWQCQVNDIAVETLVAHVRERVSAPESPGNAPGEADPLADITSRC